MKKINKISTWIISFTISLFHVLMLFNFSYNILVFERNRCHPLKKNQYTTCTASVVIKTSASWTSFYGDGSVAQLVALMSGVVLGGPSVFIYLYLSTV